MKPISAMVFFIISTLCVLRQQQLVVGNDDQMKLIEEACQQSPHKDLCISTLKNDPNSKGADITGLAHIAIKLAATNASNIDQDLRSVMTNTRAGLEPMIEQELRDCMEYYTDANEKLDNSAASLSAKAYNVVEKWVKVAISDANSCNELMSRHTNMMASETEGFRQLCNNVLAIIKVLTQTHK